MPTDLPLNISTYGSDIDGLIRFIYWTVGAWFVVAEALLLWFIVHHRRRDGQRAKWLPADTLKANMWVLAPVVLVFMFDMAIEARSHHVWQNIKVDVPAHE